MEENLKDKIKEIAPELLKEETLALYFKLEEIAENLEKIANKEMPKMEIPDTHKVEIAGAEVITIKGEKGDVGDKGDQGEMGLNGKDGKNGKDGIDGRNGLDGLNGIDGKNGENGKDGSPDTAEQVKEKLLEVGLNIEDITDLKDTLEEIKNIKEKKVMFGGGFSYSAMNFHIVDDEVVSGSGTSWTLKNVPSPATSLKLYARGQRLPLTIGYTRTGASITTVDSWEASDLRADYRT